MRTNVILVASGRRIDAKYDILCVWQGGSWCEIHNAYELAEDVTFCQHSQKSTEFCSSRLLIIGCYLDPLGPRWYNKQ